MRTIGYLGLVALLALPGAAAAQSGSRGLCGELAMHLPPVGAWAEYRTTGGESDSSRFRMAVVGSEQRGGKTLDWVEMKADSPRGTMITQMLTGSFPVEPGGVQALVVKMGDRPAMAVDSQMSGMMTSRMRQGYANQLKKDCAQVKLVGTETVTVPAGTFRTRHYRNEARGGEAWLSSDAPFGLVKMSDPSAGRSLTLVASGKGARSSITEKPQPMGRMGPMGATGGRPPAH